jgi:hypothetical protein
MPPSYRINATRKGTEWKFRHLAMLVVPRGETDPETYWSQVGTSVHEMTHMYLDSLLSGYDSLRWLEDGTCNLLEALFLERHAPPAAVARFEKDSAISDLSSAEATIFDWPEVEMPSVFEDHVREAERYSLAYRLVRSIYERDQGQSLRALLAAFRKSVPRNREQMEPHLQAVLHSSAAELLEQVRAELPKPGAQPAGAASGAAPHRQP